jgi:PAS domain S-box-containing protein
MDDGGGGGEMAGRVRAFDWSATPLGPREEWPQSLRTAVQMVLAAPFPNVLLWGPDLIQVYNDAYRDLMGTKHPAGLGRPTRDCWPEVWHLNAPVYERVWRGESVSMEDALFPVTRSGVLEDAWFTVSYSPVRDESGAVAGVLVTVFETTARVQADAGRREAEELARAVMAHLPGGSAFVVGPDLRYRFADGEGLEAAGMAPEDFLGRTVAEVVGPELAAVYEPLYRAALERGQPFAHEHDAHGRSFVSRGAPLRDASGRVHAALAVSYDITERKRAEEALKAGEERQAFLLNLSDTLRALVDEKEIEEAGLRMLAEFLRLDRAYIFVLFPSEDRAAVRAEQRNQNLASLVGEVRMSDFPETVRQIEDETLVVHDIDGDPRLSDLNRASLAAVDLQAFVCASARTGDKGERRVIWSLAAASASSRTWTRAEVELIEIAAERLWAAAERAKTEAALRASEERLRLALDASGMGAFRYHVLEDRGEPDARMLTLFGIPEGGDLNLAEALSRMIHPDDRAGYAAAVARSTDPAGDGYLKEDIRVVHPGGEVRWIGITAQTYFETAPDAPAGDRGRRPVWMYGVSMDITDRKRAEAALRESEARLSAIFSRASVGLSEVGPDGRFLRVNDALCHLLGRSREELLTLGVDDVTHPEDVPSSRAALARAASAGGAPVSLDKRYLRPDGTEVWANSSVTPLWGGGAGGGHDGSPSSPSSFLVVTADLTQRRKYEQWLIRANEVLEERVVERTAALAATNSELAAALSSLEAALSERRDLLGRLVAAQEEERRRISRELHDEMGQLLTGFSLRLRSLEGVLPPPSAEAAAPLLSELRRLTEGMGREVHRLAVELRPTSLDDLGLVPALEAYTGEWAERTGVPAEFAAVGMDGERLPPLVETTAYRVVQEALNNAAKYAVPAGATRVAVTLQRVGDRFQATVEDDGPGFDLEEAASRGRLGLVGMRERAEMVGGEVEIETGPGEGTTVYLRVVLGQALPGPRDRRPALQRAARRREYAGEAWDLLRQSQEVAERARLHLEEMRALTRQRWAGWNGPLRDKPADDAPPGD